MVKEKGNTKKESHCTSGRFEGFTSLDCCSPQRFSDFLETGTPHLNGCTGCRTMIEKLSRCSASKSRQLAHKKMRYSQDTLCMCMCVCWIMLGRGEGRNKGKSARFRWSRTSLAHRRFNTREAFKRNDGAILHKTRDFTRRP